MRASGLAALLALALLALPTLPGVTGGLASSGSALAAQDLLQVTDGSEVVRVELGRQRGYAALPASELGRLGWRFSQQGDAWIGRLAGGAELRVQPGNPFVRLGGEWVQLVDPPFLFSDELHLPLQLVVDVFPDRLSEVYAVGESGGVRELTVLDPALWEAGFTTPTAPISEPEPLPADEPEPVTRVVVIDAGHGGEDPGTLGPNQTREKDVALAIARALRDELVGTPGLEVHMIRDSDVLVPLWERGEIATRLKGDRPGIFLSIHANSVPGMRDVRGYETYFLSEARTEHEARVAALENSAVELEGGNAASGPGAELGSILNELRNLDHQHWSSDLASRVQEEVMQSHPGRDRGVKQGPLAVLTNALMPSVLIEAGFISNPDEERLLRDPDFHADIAREIAEAVRAFFQRYPPGVPGLGSGDR